MKIITKENARAEELRLMETLNFNELHVEDKRDRGGKYFYIKELETCVYCPTIKEYLNCLNNIIENYLYATSKDALNQIKKIAKEDNKIAEFLGLKKWEPLEVKLLSDNYYGVKIKFDNGEVRNYVETGFTYNVKNKDRMREAVENRKNRRYFTAGGLEDKDVDFIFNGVGHSTKKDLYSFDGRFEVIA